VGDRLAVRPDHALNGQGRRARRQCEPLGDRAGRAGLVGPDDLDAERPVGRLDGLGHAQIDIEVTADDRSPLRRERPDAVDPTDIAIGLEAAQDLPDRWATDAELGRELGLGRETITRRVAPSVELGDELLPNLDEERSPNGRARGEIGHREGRETVGRMFDILR
jgi:hypothetical protein